jgi:hypothetical protein
VLAHAVPGLSWRHAPMMLSQGLAIASEPLTATESFRVFDERDQIETVPAARANRGILKLPGLSSGPLSR